MTWNIWCDAHPLFQPRSEVIATYAMCGFGNFAELGITIGIMGVLAPSRKSKWWTQWSKMSKLLRLTQIYYNCFCLWFLHWVCITDAHYMINEEYLISLCCAVVIVCCLNMAEVYDRPVRLQECRLCNLLSHV